LAFALVGILASNLVGPRFRTIQAFLIALGFGIAAVTWINTRPEAQINRLEFVTENNCTARREFDSGDFKAASPGGDCTIRQDTQQSRTYAERNRFTATFTVRRYLSIPGTGFAVVDSDGEIHLLLVRQRGFDVGRNWCLEVWESRKDRQSGETEIHRLNAETCLTLIQRPDRVHLTLDYDGSRLRIETKFISERPRKSAYLANPQIVSIAHPLPRPQKILALITTVGQRKNDQRGFDAAILNYWWQKYADQE
jgi:hypothetical protein